MVGIRSAGSAAKVRRMRREIVLTRFRGDAQDTPLNLEDRACASVVLDFERNEQPTPEQLEFLRAVEAALAKDPRSAGEPVSLVKRGWLRPSIPSSTTSNELSAKKSSLSTREQIASCLSMGWFSRNVLTRYFSTHMALGMLQHYLGNTGR